MNTVNDRIEAHEGAVSVEKAVERAIAATEAEIARLARIPYATGGYVLMATGGMALVRVFGMKPGYNLHGVIDGLRAAENFTTMSEAVKVRDRWNNALAPAQIEAGCGVEVRVRTDALERVLFAQRKALATAKDQVSRTSDPYFDASPSAQHFDANTAF